MYVCIYCVCAHVCTQAHTELCRCAYALNIYVGDRRRVGCCSFLPPMWIPGTGGRSSSSVASAFSN